MDSFIDTLFELEIVESGTGLETVFWRYDWDNSGTLNPSEFLSAFEQQYNKWKVYWPKQPNCQFYDKIRELLWKQQQNISQLFEYDLKQNKKNINAPVLVWA